MVNGDNGVGTQTVQECLLVNRYKTKRANYFIYITGNLSLHNSGTQ